MSSPEFGSEAWEQAIMDAMGWEPDDPGYAIRVRRLRTAVAEALDAASARFLRVSQHDKMIVFCAGMIQDEVEAVNALAAKIRRRDD